MGKIKLGLFSLCLIFLMVGFSVKSQVLFGDCHSIIRLYTRYYFSSDRCDSTGKYFSFIVLNKSDYQGDIVTGNDDEVCYIRQLNNRNLCTVENNDANIINSITPFNNSNDVYPHIIAFYTDKPLDNKVFIPQFHN